MSLDEMTKRAQFEWERAEREKARAEYERERADLAELEAAVLWHRLEKYGLTTEARS